MTWEGKSLAEICTQLKDQRRNGGRGLNAILKQATEDSLVRRPRRLSVEAPEMAASSQAAIF
jgi:hypothetical protein